MILINVSQIKEEMDPASYIWVDMQELAWGRFNPTGGGISLWV